MSYFLGVSDFNLGLPRSAGEWLKGQQREDWLRAWDDCMRDRRAKRQHLSLAWSAGQALAGGSEQQHEMAKRGQVYKGE